MPHTIKLATAAIALLLTAAVVGAIAYDKGRTHSQQRTLRYDLSLASEPPVVTGQTRRGMTVTAQTFRYRVKANAKTVTNLAEKRKGCALTRALPPEATCDIAVAFPDVGVNGTVTFVGSNRNRSSDDALTFKLTN
jgi:hypothetical protein